MKYTIFFILLTVLCCISGCGNSAVEAEAETNVMSPAEIVEKEADMAEGNPDGNGGKDSVPDESILNEENREENAEKGIYRGGFERFREVALCDAEGERRFSFCQRGFDGKRRERRSLECRREDVVWRNCE